MTEKISDETKERARQLRAEGKSIREIGREVGLGTGSTHRIVSDIKPAGTAATPGKSKDLIPGAGKIDMSPESQELADRVRQTQIQTQQIEAEIANRAARRRLALLQLEEELENEERRIELHERRLRLGATGGGEVGTDKSGEASGTNDEAQAQLISELKSLQESRLGLERERAALSEQRHRAEIDSLRVQITELSGKLDSGRQVGKNQYDLVSEGLQLLGTELSGLRKDALAAFNSPNVRERFDPGRNSLAARRQEGESLVDRIEKKATSKLRCPGCGGVFEVSETILVDFDFLECPSCLLQFPNPRKQLEIEGGPQNG